MGGRTYWLDLFTSQTWDEFQRAGAKVSGFRESRWNTVQKIEKGDYLLCYMTGISRWVGLLEVTSKAFEDTKAIWKEEQFPARIGVRPIIMLTPENGVPVHDMRDRLSAFRSQKIAGYSLAWTGKFRGSPAKWSQADGEAVVDALKAASANPVVRPIDPAKLKYRPKAVEAKMGLVTIPESEPAAGEGGQQPDDSREPTAHTEIQSLLLRLGSEMGFEVWVARNDRGRSFGGVRFQDYPRLKSSLPLQFDDATNRTIELIDVLWLSENRIVAAFEIESTTSVYSGLLRMADLVAMQPNSNIPLYLVAPDERRSKVMEEVNRPTFSKLSPKLADVCRFIAFSSLRDRLAEVKGYLKYLKPEFVEELAEDCVVES